jgi:cell division protein FtsB
MDTLPIDLTQLMAAIMASLLVLIPVLGLAIRFAAKPFADALVASRGEGARPADLEALRTRIDALEHEVKELNGGAGRPALPEARPIPLRP